MLSLLFFAFASAEPLPTASADACAMYEAIHREQFASRNATDHGLALRARGPDRRDVTCPGWKHWSAAPTEVVVFDAPRYRGHRGEAWVDYTVLAFNHHWDVNRITNTTPFSCRLERTGRGWRIKICAETGIADH